jgi:pilus assembly protein CpaB
VILSRRDRNPDKGGADIINSEIILTNIRVLAIDQAPKEKDGTSAIVGKTVTLELKPEQAETLARSRQSGTLSLALRSITDVSVVDAAPEEPLKRSTSISVVRYGIATQSTAQK